jgi:SET domain-containing protein
MNIPRHSVYGWINPKCFVGHTESHGKGIFAAEAIAQGEIVNIAGGRVMTLEEELSLPADVRDGGLQIAEDFVLSSEETEDSGYFNHSCDPNAGMYGQIMLVAMRAIAKGEEVTFDYAMVLYRGKSAKPYQLECACGKPSCRG